ncbi:hypothetical protein [Tenacibaculum larymnensis]|uniref:Uncharacterized protein n=1 Tax=Tenacibaculum larymnensis TaxID=2878201 RepID=A0A9X4EPR6_9FLAO|nr:hypothetical protein [Tenacibaculum larymnensis]MDE1206390.1 hypothetical protein [Tenacibaculum larymnensis]
MKQISHNSEPSIIGVNNGVYQLEFLKKNLKKNKNYSEINHFLLGYNTDYSVEEEQAFVSNLKIEFLKGSFLKNAKKTDIVVFTPHLNGYHFVISQKFLDCLNEIGVSKDEYHIRKIEVDNVAFNYYLFFVPMIPVTEIIFPKSALFPEEDALLDNIDKRYTSFKNYQDYKKYEESHLFNRWAKITLEKKYQNRDIINLQLEPDLFFSDRLINKLKLHKITSLVVKDSPILCFE